MNRRATLKQSQTGEPGLGRALVSSAAVLIGLAWLMAAAGWVYPPIPMFLAAVLGGWLCLRRPALALRAGLWAGLVAGALAEPAYWLVRLQHGGYWAQLSSWELLGLGAAEVILYTACLVFFATFTSWVSDSGSGKIKNMVVEIEETTTARLPTELDASGDFISPKFPPAKN